jgi:phosphoribosyl-AMP cyclohydrolase / phosphoribosyl-ATP pyrophosphohydrolase
MSGYEQGQEREGATDRREGMEELKWDEKGILPVVIQDARSRDVLMVAYMNKEAFELTVQTGTMHYYSRSRQRLWRKGETSGHFQVVKDLYLDCDNDTLLALVDQNVAACHTGYWSCFYRALREGQWKVVGTKVFDEKKTYGDRS